MFSVTSKFLTYPASRLILLLGIAFISALPVTAQQPSLYSPEQYSTYESIDHCVGPCNPSPVITGIDSCQQVPCGEPRWKDRQVIPWQVFAQGEYVGPARLAHVPEYRLRVDDQLDFIYRLTRAESATAYRLNVGDQIRVESLTDETLNRELVVQPDGSITLLLLGQIQASRKTIKELTAEIEKKYITFYKVPAITITQFK